MKEISWIVFQMPHNEQRIDGWDFGDDGTGDCAPTPHTFEHVPEKCWKCKLQKEINLLSQGRNSLK